jgi:hypothetical protein
MVHLQNIVEIQLSKTNGFYTTECRPQNWPSIYLLISNYWLEILPEHYLIDASLERDRSNCIVAFAKNEEEYFLVGDTLFRGCYSVHDD